MVMKQYISEKNLLALQVPYRRMETLRSAQKFNQLELDLLRTKIRDIDENLTQKPKNKVQEERQQKLKQQKQYNAYRLKENEEKKVEYEQDIRQLEKQIDFLERPKNKQFSDFVENEAGDYKDDQKNQEIPLSSLHSREDSFGYQTIKKQGEWFVQSYDNREQQQKFKKQQAQGNLTNKKITFRKQTQRKIN